MNNLRTNKKGFTLVELVVVIAIIIILVAVAVPLVGGLIDRAAISSNASDAQTCYNAAVLYQTDAQNRMGPAAASPAIAVNTTIDVNNRAATHPMINLGYWPGVSNAGTVVNVVTNPAGNIARVEIITNSPNISNLTAANVAAYNARFTDGRRAAAVPAAGGIIVFPAP